MRRCTGQKLIGVKRSGRKIGRYVEIVWYCMRMKAREQRRELLRMNVDNMSTMDIQPFQIFNGQG